MKLCSFRRDGRTRAGLVSGEMMIDLTSLASGSHGDLPTTVLGWIERGQEGRTALEALAGGESARSCAVSVSAADLVAPIAVLPRNVICVGANYAEHVNESERVVGAIDLPDDPVYFTKDVRSICGPYDDIVVDPDVTAQLDWEVELAVIIGSEARNVTRDQALEHVWGYTILNDVSARDIQLTRNQWWKGKSLEGSSPMGPFLVTADEIPDAQNLDLWCWVDGKEKQHDSTSQMVHGVADIIADLSTTLTLRPGDVIATGTPAGVGLARSPQEWLTGGRVLESEIAGLGRQVNRIVTRERATDG